MSLSAKAVAALARKFEHGVICGPPDCPRGFEDVVGARAVLLEDIAELTQEQAGSAEAIGEVLRAQQLPMHVRLNAWAEEGWIVGTRTPPSFVVIPRPSGEVGGYVFDGRAFVPDTSLDFGLKPETKAVAIFRIRVMVAGRTPHFSEPGIEDHYVSPNP